jgi:hypothetical protein
MLRKFFIGNGPISIPKEEKPKVQKKSEPETITFNQSDNCFERAEKIIRITGLVDNLGLANHAAKGIQIYMDLDKQVAEFNNNNEG